MQKSFSDLEYAAKEKLTRRDRFPAEIDSVTQRRWRSSISVGFRCLLIRPLA